MLALESSPWRSGCKVCGLLRKMDCWYLLFNIHPTLTLGLSLPLSNSAHYWALLQPSVHVLSTVIFTMTMMNYYICFTLNEAEAQRAYVICLRSHSWWAAELGFWIFHPRWISFNMWHFVSGFFLFVWWFCGPYSSTEQYLNPFIANSIPLYGDTTLCIHSSVDGHLDGFHFWPIVNGEAMNIHARVLHVTYHGYFLSHQLQEMSSGTATWLWSLISTCTICVTGKTE